MPPSSATGPQFSHFALREGQILGANRHTQPTTGGYAGYSGTTGVSYSTPAGGMTPESKRKRGRPTKLESEARRQAAMARGEPYPMPKTNSSDPARPSAVGQNNTPSRPAPIQEPRIMNQDAMDDDNSPGSTGKRKRGRPSNQTSSLIHMSPLGQPDESPITGETQHTYNQEAVQASLQGRTEYESVSAENVSMMNMMKPAGQSNSPSLGSHQHRQLSNVHGLEGSGMMQ